MSDNSLLQPATWRLGAPARTAAFVLAAVSALLAAGLAADHAGGGGWPSHR